MAEFAQYIPLILWIFATGFICGRQAPKKSDKEVAMENLTAIAEQAGVLQSTVGRSFAKVRKGAVLTTPSGRSYVIEVSVGDEQNGD